LESKVRKLFIVLGAFFVTNALLAEFIGVKIFSLERTFGFLPVNWELLGFENLSFNLTAGVLIWPFVFVLTDIINEYFGRRGVRLLTFLAVGMIGYAFLMVTVAIHTIPADFWVFRPDHTDPNHPLNMEKAFNAIFGQGQSIIIGSLTAFIISQLVDIYVFHGFRKLTGNKNIWLRSTGSTIVSQLVDSFVVLYIAFHLSGPKWPLKMVLAIATINYVYKVVMAIVMTPLIYLAHYLIDLYLGKRLSHRIIESAAMQK
jgi:uncharacterized integral membrane protein (TIGR00697 family)